MDFKLTIACDNAAFGESDAEALAETARILRETARRIDNGTDCGKVLDHNGNTVGEFAFDGEKE